VPAAKIEERWDLRSRVGRLLARARNLGGNGQANEKHADRWEKKPASHEPASPWQERAKAVDNSGGMA
jgi:hypothetical protein